MLAGIAGVGREERRLSVEAVAVILNRIAFCREAAAVEILAIPAACDGLDFLIEELLKGHSRYPRSCVLGVTVSSIRIA